MTGTTTDRADRASTASSLELPNDARYLHMARAYVGELAEIAGLPAERREKLVLAADEACTNIIQHAFESDEQGSFRISGSVDEGELRLSFLDRGMPFDPSSAPAYEAPNAGSAGDTVPRGIGFHLIKQAADTTKWINHGREGKELVLGVKLPGRHITEQLASGKLAPWTKSDEEAPRPEHSYKIRRLRPEEAIQVSQCIYRAYGNSYPNEDLFYPERINSLNRSGELISIVAVDETGEVAGHYALERPGLGPVAESGQAVVAPSHRGHRLMVKMRDFLEEEAVRVGLSGICGHAVAGHTRSQRANASFGSSVCGIHLASSPSTMSFRKIRSEPLKQRLSCVMYFKAKESIPTTSVFVHPRHADPVKGVYERLGIEIATAAGDAGGDEGRLQVSYDKTWGFGLIRVSSIGRNTATELKRGWNDLVRLAEAEVVYLELPLSQGGIGEISETADELGFIFASVIPFNAADGGDALTLQWVRGAFDTRQLHIYDDSAKELLTFMYSELERTKGLRKAE